MHVELMIALGIGLALIVLWLTRKKDDETSIVQLEQEPKPVVEVEPYVVHPASPEYWAQIEEIGKPVVEEPVVEVAPVVQEPVVEVAPKKKRVYTKKEPVAKPAVKKVVVKKVAPAKKVAAKKTSKK